MNRTKLFKQIYKLAQSTNPSAQSPGGTNVGSSNQTTPPTPSPSPPPSTSGQSDKSKGFDVMGTLQQAYNYVRNTYGGLKGNIRDALKNVVNEKTADVISQWGTPALLGLLFALGYKLLFNPREKNWFSAGILGALAGVSAEALAYFLGGGFGKKEDKGGASAAAAGGSTPPSTSPAGGPTPPSTSPAGGGMGGQAAGGTAGP